jgi:hypothetical protein
LKFRRNKETAYSGITPLLKVKERVGAITTPMRTPPRSVVMDGCPTFASAYSGFPVDLTGVGELHAPFLKRKAHTRPVSSAAWQEIRVGMTKERETVHKE